MTTKTLIISAIMLLATSSAASAKEPNGGQKDKAKVTFLVSMTCESCQKRIEDNVSFEKGVTGLDVDLPKKAVTIEYRKDKTSPEQLKSAIQKMGYTVTPLKAGKKDKAGDKMK